nr:MAG TPA: hypothetical protein [Caudoviricetes sp.]
MPSGIAWRPYALNLRRERFLTLNLYCQNKRRLKSHREPYRA